MTSRVLGACSACLSHEFFFLSNYMRAFRCTWFHPSISCSCWEKWGGWSSGWPPPTPWTRRSERRQGKIRKDALLKSRHLLKTTKITTTCVNCNTAVQHLSCGGGLSSSSGGASCTTCSQDVSNIHPFGLFWPPPASAHPPSEALHNSQWNT